MLLRQPLDPFQHHLRVAQLAQAAEQRLAQFLHLLPFGIGIDGEKAVRHRAATPNGHAQVVHRIGREVLAGLVALFQHALRPIGEARLLSWVWEPGSMRLDTR